MKLEGKRILLVEDEYLIVQDMVRAFTAAGATVLGPVRSLSDALRLVASSGPLDGAVLDINLQGEMVYRLADVLMNRGVAFVFYSGYDDHDGVVRCEKPISPEQVAKALFGPPD